MNYSQIMMSVLNKIDPKWRSHVRFYLDDIIIYSKTKSDHIKILDEVFRVVNEAKMVVSREKCHLLKQNINILGMIIGKNGRKVDPERVKAITLLKAPKNVKQVQKFLGVVNFCAPSCSHFQNLLHPITELLTKENKKFVWTEKCEASFEKIKEEIASERVLAFPKPEEVYKIFCDSSDLAIGAILTQPDLNGVLRPIAFLSKKLSKRQSRWGISEKELLAATYSTWKCRDFLMYTKFEIYSDNSAIKDMLTSDPKSAKVARYTSFLAEMGAKIYFISGRENIVADYFTRAGKSENPITENELDTLDHENIEFEKDCELGSIEK